MAVPAGAPGRPNLSLTVTQEVPPARPPSGNGGNGRTSRRTAQGGRRPSPNGGKRRDEVPRRQTGTANPARPTSGGYQTVRNGEPSAAVRPPPRHNPEFEEWPCPPRPCPS